MYIIDAMQRRSKWYPLPRDLSWAITLFATRFPHTNSIQSQTFSKTWLLKHWLIVIVENTQSKIHPISSWEMLRYFFDIEASQSFRNVKTSKNPWLFPIPKRSEVRRNLHRSAPRWGYGSHRSRNTKSLHPTERSPPAPESAECRGWPKKKNAGGINKSYQKDLMGC